MCRPSIKTVALGLLLLGGLAGCAWQPPFYGTTQTTPELRADILQLLRDDLALAHHCTGKIQVVDTRITAAHTFMQAEDWRVQACGHTHLYTVTLTPTTRYNKETRQHEAATAIRLHAAEAGNQR